MHVGERVPETGVGVGHASQPTHRIEVEWEKPVASAHRAVQRAVVSAGSVAGGSGRRCRRGRAPTRRSAAPPRPARARTSRVLAAISSSSRSTGVGLGLDPVGVVGRVADQRERQLAPRPPARSPARAVCDTAVTPAGREPADLRLRVEARAVDVAVAAAVAHRHAGVGGARQQRRAQRRRVRVLVDPVAAVAVARAAGGTCRAGRRPAGWRRSAGRRSRSASRARRPGSTAPQTVTASTPGRAELLQRGDVGEVGDVVGEPHVALAVARDVQDVDARERPARDERVAPLGRDRLWAGRPRSRAASRCPSP